MTVFEDNHPSLQVIRNGEILYETTGKWLYPLFDLEESLTEQPFELETALVRDKVIGKAAALLMVRLGVVRVHGDVMSELALSVFEKYGIAHSFDELVPRIACQTEEILKEVQDPDMAYEILCQRAGRC